jgi:hypothetical protein
MIRITPMKQSTELSISENLKHVLHITINKLIIYL